MPDSDAIAAGALVGNLLLVRARAGQVGAWVGKGLVAAHVTPLGDWTAVTPARVQANTAPPYDDARTTLAARPVSTALRPAIGFFVHGRRGIVVVQPQGWRAVKRWLVWTPEDGPVRAPRLTNARPADLATVAGIGASGIPAVVAAVKSAHAAPIPWLAGLHAALHLPGQSLLTEPGSPRGALVEPSPKRVAAFDHLAREEAAHRAEVVDEPQNPGEQQ
ncbi:hypothetical protein [Nostocoides australiense]|nr:hypothetical protein [Actinomycetota bacterium]MCB1253029.1 hypothetical protein [Austwickia sp.]HPF79444.1 hypothetical protein [Tetrasphaera australiensis]HRW00837.1 hypothetical protein [Tetrasphaera sp.]